jgi:hypothetical protein
VEKPGEEYCRYGLYHNNILKSVIIFCAKRKHDGVIGYVMEYIFPPAYKKEAKRLLKFCNDVFKKNKVDVVLTWSFPGSFNEKAYKGGGYYFLPEKLRPQKLFIGVKVFDSSIASLAAVKKNWYISYADSDTA